MKRLEHNPKSGGEKMSKFLVVTLALLFSMTVAFGQTTSGVTGIVTDTTGAVVPGVKVTLLDTKNSREQSTVTNDQGVYKFTNLQPGAGYRITVAGQGFQTYVLDAVQIGIASDQTHNVQLTAGQISETVTVVSTTGEATLNTSNASIGKIIGTRELHELPIQLRGSPAVLIGSAPGAVGTNVFAGAVGGNRSGSVAGSRADQGNVTLDGIDVNDQAGNFAFATVANAPIDSVQEFRAITTGAGASSGRSSGGETELTTNSGTNQFHGNVREYYRDETVAANTFFNNATKVARPKLRRHQYGGSIGGPIPILQFGEGGRAVKSGKDHLFFFFDMENRKDRSQSATSRTVPLPNFLAGNIGYINNGAGCTSASRINTTPACISFLSLAQAAALDPQGIGRNAALFAFLATRYPTPPNDPTGGDGKNTGLLRFNAPNIRDEVTYTTRIDGNPTDRQRIFFRLTKAPRDSTNALAFLPGDPDAVVFKDRSYGFVFGWNWTISPNLTNVATVGMTKQVNIFTPASAGSFPFSFSGGPVGAPFPSQSYQDRNVFVPTIRDDVTYTTGNHTFQAGFSWKPIVQKSTLTNDFIFAAMGIGGLNTQLNASLRPANINTSATVLTAYDSAFSYLLGRFSSVSTNYNLTNAGVALPPGSGKKRSYKYNESEFYFQDNWRIKNNLTLNLGVRYHLYPAPYDQNGLQADNTTDWNALFATRVANAAAGIASNSSEPFLVYNLSGKGNPGGTPLYATDKNNFAPRIGFAYNPSFKGGVMGTLFGDRKTVLHGNWSMVYDRVAGAVTFIENQVDYLFSSNVAKNFGFTGNANTALLNDPRFTSISSAPGAVSTIPPTITHPLTPFVTAGVGTGLKTGTFNYTIDHNFKIPRAYTWSLGYQRELRGNMLLDVSYAGRMGRGLFVQSDVAQVLNFKDTASGQFLFPALNAMQAQVQAGVPVTAQPWIENQMNAALGSTCAAVFGATCTAVVMANFSTLVNHGDTSDLIQALYANNLLKPNVGMSSQFGSNLYITNQGTSDYHGALVSLQKRFSRGLEFGVNYTFSKSLDNNSTVANTVSGGLVCDVINPDICRGPSDFDIRHLFNASYIYELPFGRGKAFGGGANKLVDALLGGWTLSGIISARSGLPINGSTGAFPLGFNLNSPPILSGSPSALAVSVHDVGTTVQYFADPVAANAAFRYPSHGELGSRNVLRGPMYWGADMGLSKKINAPWSEKQRFTLRVDAFNVTNTNAFSTPNLTKDSSSFGLITASANTPREIQFALRFDF